MFFLYIILLTLSALFDYKYHKIRSDILIILLFISTILWLESSNKTNLVTDVLLITLFFFIFYITNQCFYKNTPFYKKTPLAILSSGDKILFLSLMLFSGVEKGIIIILFGLLVALIWVNVTKKISIQSGCRRRTFPFYPFMAFSLIIIGMIN